MDPIVSLSEITYFLTQRSAFGAAWCIAWLRLTVDDSSDSTL